MTRYYSKSTGWFYTSSVNGADIPDDAVEITDEEHAALLQGQAEGKRIVPDENGRPTLADPPPPGPPQVVTRAQGKAALIGAGLWSQVLAYVDSIADPTQKALAEVALNDTTEWRRESPFLNAAAAALGLTDQQLDDLFVTAAAIVL